MSSAKRRHDELVQVSAETPNPVALINQGALARASILTRPTVSGFPIDQDDTVLMEGRAEVWDQDL